ncbi:MAG TPA: nuclear transport factor 2 family protein [Burkholderiales bacterium]|nr:nuclear transport factor 2 family protein [Burkholderiales bacterium]
MSGVFASFLEELEARTAIEDCLKRFARAVDRQDWALARTLYHDDAFDDHGFFKGPPDAFLAHIAKMHEVQEHSMHFNTNVLIEFESRERAFVETYVLVLQRFADRRVTASARYLDRFERRNGEWRVAHRTLVFGDMVPEPIREPLAFPPEFTEQKHSMGDPLYSLRKRRT